MKVKSRSLGESAARMTCFLPRPSDAPTATARRAPPACPGNRWPISMPPGFSNPGRAGEGRRQAYDLSSFCRLLRKGIDPVNIMIAREMPTYNLSDDECASLWKFVSAQGALQ